MDKSSLTKEEQQHLKDWITQMEKGELSQVQDLINNCDITYNLQRRTVFTLRIGRK